ncbi:MAG: hypothetical protein Crog4KO_26240 [Crocinitomicaceae bacterium]
MAFNGTEGEFISIDEGGQMTAAWRNGGNGDQKGVFFGKDRLESMLNQDGCAGVRMYFAENQKGEKTLVLVGVEADENDMINGLILDRGPICPTTCSPDNPLNS